MAVLSSQLAVLHFYSRLGFTVSSGVFLEAGIPHMLMTRVLQQGPPIE